MLYMLLTDSTKYDKSLTEVGGRSHTLYFFMDICAASIQIVK